MTKLKKLLVKLLQYGVEFFVVIISSFPLIWIIVSSFKSNAEVLEGPFVLPANLQLGIEGYKEIFGKFNLMQVYSNSFIVAIVSVLLSTVMLTMSAYVLAKYRFPCRGLLSILLTITMLVPNHAKAQPIFVMVSKMGLTNSLLGLIFIYLGGGIAMSLFIMKANFYSIPKELDEAAFIDGAGFFRVFVSINLPLAKSGIITAAVMMFLSNWNEYFYASLVNTKAQYRTIPVLTKLFDQTFNYEYGQLFAAMVVMILPSILIYALAHEQIQESMAFSGVKG